MAWRNWNDEDELLLDICPIEAEVLAAARAVQAWCSADVDRALAALLHDSELDRSAAVRGPLSGAPRNLVSALGAPRNLVSALGELRVEMVAGRQVATEWII
jgi:hypothetical protein